MTPRPIPAGLLALDASQVSEAMGIGINAARELIEELPHYGSRNNRRIARIVLEFHAQGVPASTLRAAVMSFRAKDLADAIATRKGETP